MVRAFSLSAVLMLAAVLDACSPAPPSDQTPLILQTFEGFKDEVSLGHADQALAYLDQPTRDYLQNTITRPASSSDKPVDLLIRRAAMKLSPQGIGPGFQVEKLLQTLLNKIGLHPADLDPLTLGPVIVDPAGQKAYAEALWTGRSTTLHVMFVRDDSGAWKIDLLNLLTYASTAMTMDRTLKRETEDQQIDRLLRAVPSP